ncbi:hypothetical protein [Novosphingobium album (ex Liu et al. 2023)]|uniref:Cyclophilin-like domain-containing protein n=1 Tax=Novosphingobium album (ex Liu et al. 2023) TaxID=3031130 RepID=A0ABT5WVF0_9SPHN|nr:hypothetical protein [Novosphingobium album (ex Liu et al. 2023)]MDE8653841.1 hypothetical protein [Novosphingobium album (ex Liu et al. 2023)]
MALPLAVAAAAPVAIAQDRVSVPVSHAEQVSLRAVHFTAAQVSSDALVLVLYGADEGAKRLTMRVASAAISADYPMRGVIFGPKRNDAPSVLEFYADAQLIATYLNPSEKDLDAALAEVRRGYVDIVLPRQAGSRK